MVGFCEAAWADTVSGVAIVIWPFFRASNSRYSVIIFVSEAGWRSAVGLRWLWNLARGAVDDQRRILFRVGQAGGHGDAVPVPVVSLGLGGKGCDCEDGREW